MFYKKQRRYSLSYCLLWYAAFWHWRLWRANMARFTLKSNVNDSQLTFILKYFTTIIHKLYMFWSSAAIVLSHHCCKKINPTHGVISLQISWLITSYPPFCFIWNYSNCNLKKSARNCKKDQNDVNTNKFLFFHGSLQLELFVKKNII